VIHVCTMAPVRNDLMKAPLQWQKFDDTPSIKDGMSEADERIERYLSCHIVRELIRDVFKNKDKEGDHHHVQILGCYYLQLFYMFQSMTVFDSRGAVTIAAARLACKMYDEKPRGGTMYLELERQRLQRGQGGLSEEERKELRQEASEIEIFLLRLTKFETDIALPCDELDALVEKALTQLCISSESWKKICGDKSPTTEALALRERMKSSSKNFLMDGFMGLLPLRFSRRCATWSAILFALRYAARGIPMRELLGVMEQASADDGINQKEIEAGFQEIITVFKAKSQAERKARATVVPSTPATAPAAGPAAAAVSAVPAPAAAPAAAAPPVAREAPRERSRSRDRRA